MKTEPCKDCTCDSCKWWEDFKLRRLAGACNNPKLGNWIVDPDGLSVSDQHSLLCINTGPKFGCVHHEPKPFVEVFMLNTPENNKLMRDSGAQSKP